MTGDGDVFGVEGHALAGAHGVAGADGCVAGVLAGHEAASGGGADGGAGVALIELHAFGGEAVEAGGEDLLLAVAAEVGVAKVIGEDEDDVGLGLSSGRRQSGGRHKCEELAAVHADSVRLLISGAGHDGSIVTLEVRQIGRRVAVVHHRGGSRGSFPLQAIAYPAVASQVVGSCGERAASMRA